jgi:3',5'-cyclic AMP phosphodiesterase CpdA
MPPTSTLLAQISDPHIDGGPWAAERLTRVAHRLRTLSRPVDALLVTGDIADTGAAAEYEEAARILDGLPFPVLWCPGNHDDRGAYRKVLLGEAPAEGPVNRLHRVGGTAILMCDSTVPGEDAGLLDAETSAWIEDSLGSLPPGTPVLLAFHHPPVELHVPLPDSIRLADPDRLAALLARHPEVVAVLTGHAHTAVASVFAGRPLVSAPAVTWAVHLPWASPEPADRDQPPGIAYHLLGDDGRLTTHFRVVP